MKSTETSNFNLEPVSLEGGPNYSDTMSKTGSSCNLRGSGGGGGGGVDCACHPALVRLSPRLSVIHVYRFRFRFRSTTVTACLCSSFINQSAVLHSHFCCSSGVYRELRIFHRILCFTPFVLHLGCSAPTLP